MKKVLLYLPSIVYAIVTIVLNIISQTFSPLWYIWIVLLWIGGFMLNNGKVWGGILGLLPAIHIIYMSTQEAGQVINEMPIGIITALYILICMFAVWRKSSSK